MAQELLLRISGELTTAELREFPVLVDLQDERLVGVERVAFADQDGRDLTAVLHRLETESGRLCAEVRVPRISPGNDAVVRLLCGVEMSTNGEEDVVAYMPTNETTVPFPTEMADAITVEAWFTEGDGRPETIQALVGQWALAPRMSDFAAFDASRTDDLDTTGFFGGTFDGRFIYFSPQYDREDRHGKVLRYDTHRPFRDPASWQAYDAGATSGLNTKGFYGAVFDGRYVIFPPRRNPDDFHACVLRYDTHGQFKDASSWESFDCGAGRSSQSAAFDGRYLYLCPGQRSEPRREGDARATDGSPAVTGVQADVVTIADGRIVRYDTQSDFTSRESYETFDVSVFGERVRDFDGAVYDGRYVYFAPLSYGTAVRYDTRRSFTDEASWALYDAAPLGLSWCVGAVHDGRYVYYAPYGECTAALRVDTRQAFTDHVAWERFDISRTPGLAVTGYDGAFYDGRYVYYAPYYREDTVHGVVLRYDTAQPFGEPDSWTAVDAGRTDGLPTTGFNGGVWDGRYLYCAPWLDEHRWPGTIGGAGAVLRYDTTGGRAAFSLRYCDLGHNGGLTAALPGPRFIVNTNGGTVSVAAHRPPEAGAHHLAGVYDGTTVRLFIDGELAGERAVPGGPVAACDAPLAIGHMTDGTAAFSGSIAGVRVSSTARGAAWLAARSRNLRDPPSFCRIIA